jgi:hypothetical protein
VVGLGHKLRLTNPSLRITKKYDFSAAWNWNRMIHVTTSVNKFQNTVVIVENSIGTTSIMDVLRIGSINLTNTNVVI